MNTALQNLAKNHEAAPSWKNDQKFRNCKILQEVLQNLRRAQRTHLEAQDQIDQIISLETGHLPPKKSTKSHKKA